MKAVQFAQVGGPDVLQLLEVADPVPGPEDVLIEVKATTVNRFKAGERVLTAAAVTAKGGGGYASKIAVTAADLVRIPDGISFEHAVAAGLTASTAWGGLFDLGHLQPGERVLIWAGSSGVGTIAIQLAKHAGAWVATTASSDERAATLHDLGADLVIN